MHDLKIGGFLAHRSPMENEDETEIRTTGSDFGADCRLFAFLIPCQSRRRSSGISDTPYGATSYPSCCGLARTGSGLACVESRVTEICCDCALACTFRTPGRRRSAEPIRDSQAAQWSRSSPMTWYLITTDMVLPLSRMPARRLLVSEPVWFRNVSRSVCGRPANDDRKQSACRTNRRSQEAMKACRK